MNKQSFVVLLKVLFSRDNKLLFFPSVFQSKVLVLAETISFVQIRVSLYVQFAVLYYRISKSITALCMQIKPSKFDSKLQAIAL